MTEQQMTRGMRLLLAQKKGRGKSLGPAPAHFDPTRTAAWNDIVGSCHDVLRRSDRFAVELAAMMLAQWRRGTDCTLELLRLIYRLIFGDTRA